jgi:hypothetical protein
MLVEMGRRRIADISRPRLRLKRMVSRSSPIRCFAMTTALLLAASPSIACPALEGRWRAVALARDLAAGIRLADGREVAIASIAPADPAAIEDLRALAAETDGAIEIAEIGPPDRWKRLRAHVRLRDAGGETFFLAQRQVEHGAAIVWPDRSLDDPCLGALEDAEAQARRAEAGIWARERIITAREPASLAALEGHAVVIRARLTKIVVRPSFAFLNFGGGWFRRLSVRALLSREASGSKPDAAWLKSLEGQTVLIKGVLEPGRTMPRLVVRMREQIAIDPARTR